MHLEILHQLLAMYQERLGKLFPHDQPLRVITVLRLCREGSLTQLEMIARSGLGQSVVWQLVAKLRAAGMVEASGKRGSERLGLTGKGFKLIADLENDLPGVLLKAPAAEGSFGQASNTTEESSEKTTEHASIPRDDPESDGTTAIYKAYVARFPETLDQYDQREQHLKNSGRRPQRRR